MQEKTLSENSDFIIFAPEDLTYISNEILNYLSLKKQELLTFFKFSYFPQIKIILFQNREEYYDFLEMAESDEKRIVLYYGSISTKQLRTFLKQSILHQYVEKMYAKIYKNNFPKPFWLEEGLAQILAGERSNLEKNEEDFRTFYLDKIVRRDKEIPSNRVFSESEYTFFHNNAFDGYSLSYLLVYYLLETKKDLYSILTNEDSIRALEKTIIEECISYYDKKYPVKENFYDIKNTGELMDYMNKFIVYGWIDNEGQKHINTLKGFQNGYRIGSIKETINFGIGTCVEQAKLIQYWFSLMRIENKMFCIRSIEDEDTEDEIKMHCFVLFHYQNFWYHFEHTAIKRRGIHRFATLEEALEINHKEFLNECSATELIEIPTIPDGLSYKEFHWYVNQFKNYKKDEDKKR